MRLLLLVCLCFIIIVLPSAVLAQFSGNVIGDNVAIVLDPQYPNPGDIFTATIEDYAINSSNATYVWLVNGVEETAVRGQRSIKVKAGEVGVPLTLTSRLVFTDKPTIEVTQVITPYYLDVIIEPQTYVPVFYAGRALPVHGSLVNLIALVHGKNGLIDPSTYTYSWQLNNKSVFGGPKKGASQAQITVPFGRTSLITLSIVDQNGVAVARRVFSIPSVPVKIQFYEVSTLYGLSKRAIGSSLTLTGNSSNIRAVPYNLDTRANSFNLFTEWKIDSQTVNSGDDPFEINLARNKQGSARVNFKLRNVASLLQGDEASFIVKF